MACGVVPGLAEIYFAVLIYVTAVEGSAEDRRQIACRIAGHNHRAGQRHVTVVGNIDRIGHDLINLVRGAARHRGGFGKRNMWLLVDDDGRAGAAGCSLAGSYGSGVDMRQTRIKDTAIVDVALRDRIAGQELPSFARIENAVEIVAIVGAVMIGIGAGKLVADVELEGLDAV